MDNLRSKTVRATGWVMFSQVSSQVVSFGFGIALARLLLPDDFGLVAMVVTFTGLAWLVLDVGLGSALIQKEDANEDHFSSVFWLNVFGASVLGVIFFLLAPAIGRFYGRPEVVNICRTLSIGFPVGSLAMVQGTRLRKALQFKGPAVARVVATVVSGAIGVSLAWSGFKYWSLVAQQLTNLGIYTALLWGVSKWLPRARFKYAAIRDLLGFSVSVFGTKLLQYATGNVDKLLLGKYLGGRELGVYEKGYSMMLFPLQNISQVIGAVMFPSLSLVQSDAPRVRRIYLRSIRAISLLAFPMMAGMFSTAEAFVFGVIGPEWESLIPILRVFCVAGMAASVVTVTGSLYQARGAVALQLRVNLFTQPLRIAGIVAGLPWGGIGVASGYTLTSLVVSLITLKVAGRLIELSVFTVIRTVLPTLIGSLAMGSLVWALPIITGFTNQLLLFLVQVSAGVIFYGLWIVVFRLEAYEDAKTVLIEEFRSRRNP